MADSRNPDGDSLAALNDHLARFFRHADDLLGEWKGYGDKLRASIDAEVASLQSTVSTALSQAGQSAGQTAAQAAAQATKQMIDEELQRAVNEHLARLRRELDALARTAGETSARLGSRERIPAGAGRALGSAAGNPLLWALLTANLMLMALLVLGVRECRQESGVHAQQQVQGPGEQPGSKNDSPPSAIADAAPPAPILDAAPLGLTIPASLWPAETAESTCAALAEKYDAEAAEVFVEAAAAALCSAPASPPASGTETQAPATEAQAAGRAGKVAETLTKQLEAAGGKETGKKKSTRKK